MYKHKIAAGIIAAIAVWGTIRAEMRLAVADMDRIFREYYKSRIAEDYIKQQAESFRTQLNRKRTECAAVAREAEEAAVKAGSLAVAESERAAFAVEAERKKKEAESLQAEISKFAAAKEREIARVEQKKRSEIVAEIKQVVERRAVAEGYDFVLDCSGNTANNIPAVIRYPSKYDISDAVIRELNRTKPVTRPEAPEIPLRLDKAQQ